MPTYTRLLCVPTLAGRLVQVRYASGSHTDGYVGDYEIGDAGHAALGAPPLHSARCTPYRAPRTRIQHPAPSTQHPAYSTAYSVQHTACCSPRCRMRPDLIEAAGCKTAATLYPILTPALSVRGEQPRTSLAEASRWRRRRCVRATAAFTPAGRCAHDPLFCYSRRRSWKIRKETRRMGINREETTGDEHGEERKGENRGEESRRVDKNRREKRD